MKITPLEIRQYSFEKVFRGYNSETVDAFLNTLSQEWENLQEENRMLTMQLELAEKEVNRIRAFESTMFKALKAAEETKSRIMLDAQQEAENKTKEAENTANGMVSDARRQANMLLADAQNKAQFAIDESLNELRSLERDFKAMDKYKEHIVGELRRFATDTLDKVAKFEEKIGKKSHQSQVLALETIAQDAKVEDVIDEQLSMKATVGATTEETIVTSEAIAEKVFEPAITPVAEPEFSDEEDDELPTVSSVMNRTEEMPSTKLLPNDLVIEKATSAADEIEELIREVKRGRKKVTVPELPPNPVKSSTNDSGGSFFDKI